MSIEKYRERLFKREIMVNQFNERQQALFSSRDLDKNNIKKKVKK